MTISTVKSPTKFEPNVAFTPMPASLAPFSLAAAMVAGQDAIS